MNQWIKSHRDLTPYRTKHGSNHYLLADHVDGQPTHMPVDQASKPAASIFSDLEIHALP
jgi:hypothetical protein